MVGLRHAFLVFSKNIEAGRAHQEVFQACSVQFSAEFVSKNLFKVELLASVLNNAKCQHTHVHCKGKDIFIILLSGTINIYWTLGGTSAF